MFQKLLDWLLGRIETPILPKKANELPHFNFENGTTVNIDANESYDALARKHGLHKNKLETFNQQLVPFYFFGFKLFETAKVKTLEYFDSIYIPSTDEIIYYEFEQQYSTAKEIENELELYFGQSQNLLFKTARKRCTATIGKSYGTESLVFLSPNKNLVGASESRTKTINGEKQYEVNWGADLWKCNIFMHDCVYDAGFQPDLLSNDHYITAGMLHNSDKFEKIKIAEATPGTIVQLYAGAESNESHNLILASFIDRKSKGTNLEQWSFYAWGAEAKESAVSYRQHIVNLDETLEDFYQVTEGKRTNIRFFKPLFKR